MKSDVLIALFSEQLKMQEILSDATKFIYSKDGFKELVAPYVANLIHEAGNQAQLCRRIIHKINTRDHDYAKDIEIYCQAYKSQIGDIALISVSGVSLRGAAIEKLGMLPSNLFIDIDEWDAIPSPQEAPPVAQAAPEKSVKPKVASSRVNKDDKLASDAMPVRTIRATRPQTSFFKPPTEEPKKRHKVQKTYQDKKTKVTEESADEDTEVKTADEKKRYLIKARRNRAKRRIREEERSDLPERLRIANAELIAELGLLRAQIKTMVETIRSDDTLTSFYTP